MRALIIDEAAKAAITELRQRAEANVIVMTEQKKVVERDPAAHFALMTSLTIPIEQGFSVTYSVEDHFGMVVRHISVSVDKPKKLPSPPAFEMIATEFGFTGDQQVWEVWREDVRDGSTAINAVQPLHGGH